jgi:hypothetical protein
LGEFFEGKPAKNGIQKLVSLVEDETIDLEDKWRLVLLYSISQDGLKEGERKNLLPLGKLPKRSKNTSIFQLSRFTPSIKKLVEDLTLGKLSYSEFPINK